MEQRSFGRIGEVSAVTLGGAALMGGWGHTPDRKEAVATVRAAIDGGVDHVDVAPMYGSGEAERVVGEAFGGKLPEGVRVSTKVSLDHPEPDQVPSIIERSLSASLERLRMERVDLLLTHCLLLPDPPAPGEADSHGDGEYVRSMRGLELSTFRAAVRPFLETLKERGRIGDWAISGIAAPRAVIEALACEPQPAAVQAITNVLDSAGEELRIAGPQPSDVAAAANRTGVPVIGIRAIGRGALADVLEKQVDEDHPIARDYRRARGLRDMAARMGVPAAELACRYVLSMPGIATVAVGVCSRRELADALAAAEKGPLDRETQTALRLAVAGK